MRDPDRWIIHPWSLHELRTSASLTGTYCLLGSRPHAHGSLRRLSRGRDDPAVFRSARWAGQPHLPRPNDVASGKHGRCHLPRGMGECLRGSAGLIWPSDGLPKRARLFLRLCSDDAGRSIDRQSTDRASVVAFQIHPLLQGGGKWAEAVQRRCRQAFGDVPVSPVPRPVPLAFRIFPSSTTCTPGTSLR